MNRKAKPLFVSEIVDGSRFRKLKRLRYFFYSVLFLLYILVEIMDVEHSILHDWFGLRFKQFSLIVIIVILLTGTIYYYSIQKQIQGIIQIFSDRIEITNDTTKTYKFDQISQIEITRSSTYHYEHQQANFIIQFNNFVEFITNEEQHKYEFLIDSHVKNSIFEEMIQKLYFSERIINYKSI